MGALDVFTRGRRLGRPHDPGAFAVRVVVVFQLVLLVAVAAATVREFHVWAEIDEKAHFSYVQSIAEDKRLPLLSEYIGEDLLAISQGTYPKPPFKSLRQAGLEALSYEAFQPPLYYALAAPAFLVKEDPLAKVDVLRAFDVLLLLAAVGALYLLARQAFGRDYLLPFAGGLAVFLLPGFVARGVTVSNTALELPLALLLLAALWRADATGSRRAVLGAAALLGLALLTKLTLVYLAPLYLVVLARHLMRDSRRRLATAAAGLLIPVVMLAPWLAFNHHHYGSLTATEQAREMQHAKLYGRGESFPYDAGDLPRKNRELPSPLLPQEWAPAEGSLEGHRMSFVRHRMTAWVGRLDEALKVPFLVLPALVLLIRPGLIRSREFALLVVPTLLGVALMNLTLVFADWDLFLPRYLYPVLPAFGLFAVTAWRRLLRSDRAALALTGAISAALAGLWVYLAAYFYYPSMQDVLGIG